MIHRHLRQNGVQGYVSGAGFQAMVPMRAWMLALLIVPISSILGLSRAMAELEGWDTFAGVWEANFWGDLVFVVGTVGATVAAWAVAAWGWNGPDKRLAVLALPGAFVLHWFTYATAWSLTNSPAWESAPFWAFEMAGWGEAWGYTWEWGYWGLLMAPAMSCLVAAYALDWLRPSTVGSASES